MMGLGGDYDHEIMAQVAAQCDLVAIMGGNAAEDENPTKYVWGILECSERGEIQTIPLGIGVRDEKIAEMEIDMFSQGRLNRSVIEGPSQHPEN